MIELLIMCALSTKPTAPCPPPPPLPTENLVGLPAKNVELVDDKPENKGKPLYPTGNSSPKKVLKLPKAKAKSSDYNRRGNRNH